VDRDGRIAVRGLLEGVRPPSPRERRALARLPFSEREFRADAGAARGLRLHARGAGAVHEALWHRPSIAVTALEASPVEGSSNQIVPSARARVGVRIVPGQDPRRVRAALVRHLRANVPWGLALRVIPLSASPAWATSSDGPAFEATRRALRAGYGVEPVEIGAGGSIPFVGPFARALGGVPALLIGLEDPSCNAHAEDESLHLPDFAASCRSAVHLYAELAAALR
jgi:acetylornithine deacetylase/succinyl-diaminopimelate desuccinylase-like protein